MSKLHRVLIIGLQQALYQAFFEEKYADKVLEKLLKQNKKWGSKDRSFVAESFYDIIRWKRRLAFYMDEEIKSSNLYKLIATYLLYQGYELAPFEEFKGINFKKLQSGFSKKIENPAIEHSVPDWLYNKLKSSYGKETDAIFDALNQPAEVYLRVNTLKTTKEKLVKSLALENVEALEVENWPNALVLKDRKNLFRTQAFQEGWFEVQDLSSQLVAESLAPNPGSRVLDVCAGAGGKTLHLASLMENKGQIIALDLYEWKLAELKRRARRAGAHNIETRPIVAKTIKRLKDSADFLLMDAPCTGIGVLKRNPDAKWKLDENFIDRIEVEQAEILQNYSKILRSGGKMVYATCSILPEENEKQIEKFLLNNPNFKLLKERLLLPNQTGNDGFYIAELERLS
ncbi:MAG: class I SAM-dependent methyltransferase [Chitinophagales bacterium]|nr:class I SAM-dependent methyltransferase [Chitinophagales bacterium]